jgi:hypothetical protein
MKRINALVILLVLALCYTPAKAQLKGFGIGPYLESGVPVGDLSDTHNAGWGAGVGAIINLPGKLAVTGSVGYMQFTGGSKIADLKAIPVRFGLVFRWLPIVYLKAEAGAANYTGGDGSALILAPGVGVRLLKFDFQAKYEAWIKSGTNGFFGLKAGYYF